MVQSDQLLPFYISISPSPTDARIACALVKNVVNDSTAGVSLVIDDGEQCLEVFSFSRFADVLIVWSACGRLLAFGQGNTLVKRDSDGVLELLQLNDDLTMMGFDMAGRLWTLAGQRLQAHVEQQVCITFDEVHAFVVVSGTVSYARNESEGVSLHVVNDDQSSRIAWIPGHTSSLRLLAADNFLAMVQLSAPSMDRIRARVLRFDLLSKEIEEVLNRTLAIGFNGGPGLQTVLTKTGAIFAAYEDRACTRVWSLVPGQEPQPVSPDGFEVFDFALDASGTRLAVIASDTRTAHGSFDRAVLVGSEQCDRWRFGLPSSGVHSMPRWRADGRLELLRGDDGSWNRFTYDPDRDLPNERVAVNASSLGAAYDADLLHLSGPKHRNSGIVLLPRLHQQYVAGAQAYFFHQLLFFVARMLAADGYTVVILSGPGALGRGRTRREAAPYPDLLAATLANVSLLLRESGCQSVGLLAGSLAAVPGLRSLGAESVFAGAAFVAPLFEASIPVTASVRNHLLDNPAVLPFDVAIRDLAVPTLVVHGDLDEVAPLSQVTRLCKGASPSTLVRLHILKDEGHIFSRPDSWSSTASEVCEFFDSLSSTSPSITYSRP